MNDVMSGNHSNQTNVTRFRKKKSSSYLFGWYFFSGFYNFFSWCKLERSPLLLISVCEDDPNYADKCAEKAAIKDYCVHQKEFMEKECPQSCGFCSSSKSQVVNKFTQIPFLFYNIWLFQKQNAKCSVSLNTTISWASYGLCCCCCCFFKSRSWKSHYFLLPGIDIISSLFFRETQLVSRISTVEQRGIGN